MGEVGSFVVTGSTDAATKPSHFYCRVCKKDISISAKGSYEILRHYQESRHYPRNRRMRLSTPSWRVLDFFGNPLSESDLALVQDEILKAPLHQLGQEFPFPEDLIPDSEGRVNTKMPLLAKVSSLIDVLKLGGSYELLEKLWRQSQLTASKIKHEVTWSRDEVLVSAVHTIFGFSFRSPCFAVFSQLLLTGLIMLLFQSIVLTALFPRILFRLTTWIKSCKLYSLEFEERQTAT